MVFVDDIIAIIAVPDTDHKYDKKHPAHYLRMHTFINIKPIEKPKTYIITKDITYISPVSIKTLGKRIKEINQWYLRL